MSTDEEYNKVVCDAAVRTKMRSREYYYSVVCDVAVRTTMTSVALLLELDYQMILKAQIFKIIW